MKRICANCKSSKLVDRATVEMSVKLQADIAKVKEGFTRDERREKLAAIKGSAEYTSLAKVKGLSSVTMKDTDPEEGSVYITCSNAQHLNDEKVEGEIVHKYYFECPHFEARE